MIKTVLITGAAGFIGTNLTKRLLAQNVKVIAVDNFSASDNSKLKDFLDNPNFEFIEHDIVNELESVLSKSSLLSSNSKITEVYNLACPASPPRYSKLPIETIRVNTEGMLNVLEIAKKYDATLLHTSTSEVYGDPEVHPQVETYRGNVNTVGPRSCYDEGKRISETICYEYHKNFGTKVKITRLFNTYGPYMDKDDGRVVTNFIDQALNNVDITIYGSGEQTRSFQYIDDLLNAFEKVMQTKDDFIGPINLGNPGEFTMIELAQKVINFTNSKSKLVFKPLPVDDPKKRKPDITLARKLLDWEPKVKLEEGLKKTIEYFKSI